MMRPGEPTLPPIDNAPAIKLATKINTNNKNIETVAHP
jgi:hypothetical protein